MEVTPTDQLVIDPEAKIVPEVSLQEKVHATGNQVTSEVEEEESDDEEEEDDLDTMMIDMTISIAKAKKAGDLVSIIACPHEDHKVDLKVGRGFFLIDVADIARKTLEGILCIADCTQDIQ